MVLTFDDGREQPGQRGGAAPAPARHEGDRVPRAGSHPGPRPEAPGGPRAGRDRRCSRGRRSSPSPLRALFDFQSHTLLHARVQVAPRVVGFMAPWMRHGYAAFDVPVLHRGGRDVLADEVPLGTPLLRSEPRTSESLRFLEDDAAGPARASQTVAAHGGAAFFERRGWERDLRRLVAGRAWSGRFETGAEQEARHPARAPEARRAIEQRTGRPVAAPLLPVARRRADRAPAGARGRLPHRLLRQGAGRPHHPAGRRSATDRAHRRGLRRAAARARDARTCSRSCAGSGARRMRGGT